MHILFMTYVVCVFVQISVYLFTFSVSVYNHFTRNKCFVILFNERKKGFTPFTNAKYYFKIMF